MTPGLSIFTKFSEKNCQSKWRHITWDINLHIQGCISLKSNTWYILKCLLIFASCAASLILLNTDVTPISLHLSEILGSTKCSGNAHVYSQTCENWVCHNIVNKDSNLNCIGQKMKAAGFFSTYSVRLISDSVFVNELSRCNLWRPWVSKSSGLYPVANFEWKALNFFLTLRIIIKEIKLH
jgi:hypothetical protein